MAIIQISKIQARSGNLVDLPQLDEAEFGWAEDARRLFIGKTTPNENIEVLTGYSNISFSQISGSGGNLNVISASDGQVLSYDGVNWVNRGGNIGGLINLGAVSNVKISGGSIGYVLETDGLGNLSWTPKGFLYTSIEDLTPDSGNTFGYGANAVVMTVPNTTPYFNLAQITITGVEGNSNSNVNAQTFYVRLSEDYPTSGNVILFTGTDANSAFIDGNITYTNDPNSLAVATSAALGTGGSGGGAASGSNGVVQFSTGGILDGVAGFTFDKGTSLLTVSGNANVSSVNASNLVTASRFISNVATGTAPFQVTSTTQVANLNAATAGTVRTAAQPNITSVGTLTSLVVTGNITSGNVYANSGTIGASQLAGSLTTASQPNVTSVGTLTGLTIAANGDITMSGAGSQITGVALVSSTLFAGSGANLTNLNGSNITTGTIAAARVATLNQNTTGYAATVSSAAQPNITSVGTLTGLNVNGNIVAANITANTGIFSGNGSGLSAIAGANVTGAVSFATTANAVAGANVSGAVSFATTANAVAGANVSGVVANATFATSAGTVTTNAQPNITSVGTLSSVTVTGAVTAGNVYANSGTVRATTLYGSALTTGANTTAGTITGNWTLTSGSRLQATYADLAENYQGDQMYEPGTVLEFGGIKEVTVAKEDSTSVAGVVTTEPAYVMNALCPGIAIAVALQGRVPVKVKGVIRKGDMLVSAGNGYAKASKSPKMGSVIGKALTDFNDGVGIIEVAIGRL